MKQARRILSGVSHTQIETRRGRFLAILPKSVSHDAESRDGSLTESRVAEGTELGPVSKGIQKGSERDTEAGRKELFSIACVVRVLWFLLAFVISVFLVVCAF